MSAFEYILLSAFGLAVLATLAKRRWRYSNDLQGLFVLFGCIGAGYVVVWANYLDAFDVGGAQPKFVSFIGPLAIVASVSHIVCAFLFWGNWRFYAAWLLVQFSLAGLVISTLFWMAGR